MESSLIWQRIEEQVQALQQSIAEYRQAVAAECDTISQCDKFDQDALHLLEFASFNAGESAKLIKQWRESRVLRRHLKQNIHFSQQALSYVDQLQLTTPPTFTRPQLQYQVRSQQMEPFAAQLYEKGRIEQLFFQPLQQLENVGPLALFTNVAHEAHGVIERKDNQWHVIVDHISVFQHKKLLKIVEFIVEREMVVYAPSPYDASVKNLLQRQLEAR